MVTIWRKQMELLVALLACGAASCDSFQRDDTQFASDAALDGVTFVAEATLEKTAACSADCDHGLLWLYSIQVTGPHIGMAPPALATGYANFRETDVLVAAQRFGNTGSPRFMLLGYTVLAPGGEEGAICGLPSSTAVMLLVDGESAFVFNEAGDGLASMTELLWLHDNYPEDGRRGADGLTFQQKAARFGKIHPTSTAMDAIQRSRERRPTREPYTATTDGTFRDCHPGAAMDAGEGGTDGGG